MSDIFFLPFGFVESKNSKAWQILQRYMLLQGLVIIRVVEHPINNTVLVDEFCDLFLLEYQLKYLFEFGVSLGIDAVDVNKKMLAFEIRPCQIQEKCSKCKVDPWLVILI